MNITTPTPSLERRGQNSIHIPVMVKEVIAGLNLKSGDNTIDATVGGAGHAEAILTATSPNGKLLGIDWDKKAIELSKERLAPFKNRVILKAANYTELPTIAHELNFTPVNGIVADLGLSSDQLADTSRGFSFNAEAPLDMRFSDQLSTTASSIVNTWSEEELTHIFREYGEERHAARIAQLIVASRKSVPISSSLELAELVRRGVGRRGNRHPATRIFQALRLATNQELQNVAQGLPRMIDLLAPGGRIAIITFHSLEDRIVKNFFKMESRAQLSAGLKSGAPSGTAPSDAVSPRLRIINKHVIVPTREEQKNNPRSRSAKLRVAEKL